MHRNAWALAAALAVVTVAAGCSDTPDGPKRVPSEAPPVTSEPASVAESAAKYNALTTDLVAALEAKMPAITWTVDDPARLSRAQDGRCTLSPRSMKSSADIVEPSKNFEDVFGAADPVLEKHGFPAFDGTDPVPGGWVVTRSADAAGATVTIESKSPAYLSVTVPVKSEKCDSNEIPQGDR
ncbi:MULTISPECIES: hypothetical protein [unclassified Arthrobacter]|uniref:hypothetical protein n=1 Tax=unclassified Arthrobacter TaxID=235627 RepID=UPI0020C8ABDC|nr:MULTISPECIES: hypothetical protein [unclassified Arthrobacter]